MHEDQPASTGGNDLYVGYLPTPPTYSRFLRTAAPALAILFAAGAIAWAVSYRSPGKAVWDTSHVREFTGVIHARPYAMIRVAQAEAPSRTLLLVQEGKHGAADVGQSFDGRPARVRGFVLERDGHRLLELSGPAEALPQQAGPTTTESVLHCEPGGEVTLRGEIIDPKCYFGAMKPGEGKVHKECATLCIAGGIPPMFLVRNGSALSSPPKGVGGQPDYYLIADPSGNAAAPAILPYVADPIEVRGQVQRCGDLQILRMDPATIRRL